MNVGIDEVGRGPWAGPLVVGAVVLGDAKIDGLTDSKKLSAKRRLELAEEIYSKAAAVGLGWVHAMELDEIGMSASLIEATKRALTEITVPYHEIIIDGTVNFLKGTGKGAYVTTMKKADLLISSVSAASIIAKVARDQFMQEQALLYPNYGFEAHVGYGTAKHSEAIERYGVTSIHRLSFAPLQKYKSTPLPVHIDTKVSSKQIGDTAENKVADYLEKRKHKILERNWKTKYCEIDIVSQMDDTIYFTEVKYRNSNKQGGGIAAITHKKLRQMKFGSQLYATKLQRPLNLRLAVATVANDYTVQEWLLID